MLILAGYLYVACPALAQLVPGTVELNLASHSGPEDLRACDRDHPDRRDAGRVSGVNRRISMRRRSSWRAAEALGTAFIVFLVGYIQVKYAAYPRWLLSLDRSAAITGGVSAYVPAAFLMAALGAWLYARRRIRTINDQFRLHTRISSGGRRCSWNEPRQS